MDSILRHPSSPATAGDALVQKPQALAWAKALVLATSNGVRECAPAIDDYPVGEMADATQ
jgi:hypothetical protein